MAMTRKDYALIAKAIADAKLSWHPARPEYDVALLGIRTVELNITQALISENAGFNAEKFRAACSSKAEVKDDPAVVKRAFELHGIQAKASDWRNFLPQARAELAPTKSSKEG